MTRVPVRPQVLEWAIDRSGDRSALESRFPKLDEWVAGKVAPTLKALETFAKAARVPLGYLLLPEPPEEALPIPDMRTVAGRGVRRPSPDLLDVIYLCQRRQAWYQDYAESIGEAPRTFVGSVKRSRSPEEVAAQMQSELGFSLEARRACSTWTEALRLFIDRAESIGALVMVSGIVGSNTHRSLEPEEFRGFALADKMAPLVFINGADTKAAQMFTLAHELAHLWLGESAVSDIGPASALPAQETERWCNRVAAELLVPLTDLRRELPKGDPLVAASTLARTFKVSTLVILRRILDAGRITRDRFSRAYDEEVERLMEQVHPGGGNFYLTQPARLSRRLARAVLVSTLEGQTLYRDAFGLLGIKKEETLRALARSLEVLS